MPLLTVNELEKLSPVFRGRFGNAFASSLMHLLDVDDVNDLYDRYPSLHGPDFASAVLEDIGLRCEVLSSGTLCDILPEGPFITVSNHPCGHVDGIALVDIFGHLRPDYKVMVNRILSRIENLGDNFIPVTPVGKERIAPSASSINGVKAALRHLREGGALGLFPSGAVSDLCLKNGCVRDRPWQESVLKLIMKAEVPVVPVRFYDGNSPLYYGLGLIDWRVRLLRLPSEVFNKRGKVMRIGVGPVISVEQLARYREDICSFGAFLRSQVYGMEFPDIG